MAIIIQPKDGDVQIRDIILCENTKYRAIIVDHWRDKENAENNIIGMEITGGCWRKKIVACTQKELFNKCLVWKEEEK